MRIIERSTPRNSKVGGLTFYMLLAALCLAATQTIQAQSVDTSDSGRVLTFNASYYGNFLVHPGFRLGMDWHLLEIQKAKKAKSKQIRKVLLVTPSVSWYIHPLSHSSLIINANLYWRRYGNRGFFTEVGFGLGYWRRFNAGSTYEVSSSDQVAEKPGASYGYFAPELSYGIGQQIKMKSAAPIDVFTRLNGNLLFNYNAGILAEWSWEFGARFAILSNWKQNKVKSIQKEK